MSLEETSKLRLKLEHLLPYWPSFQCSPRGLEEDGTTWTMSAALNRGREAGFLEDRLWS